VRVAVLCVVMIASVSPRSFVTHSDCFSLSDFLSEILLGFFYGDVVVSSIGLSVCYG